MLKVSGIWVSPFMVESALIAHDEVLEAAQSDRCGDALTLEQGRGIDREPRFEENTISVCHWEPPNARNHRG